MKYRKYLNKIKFTFLHLWCSYITCYKKTPEIEKEIVCNRHQIKFFANTPNTIIYFKSDDCEGYFRECRIHKDKFSFVKELISDYCDYILKTDDSSLLYNEILRYLSNNANLIKFFYMGDGTDPYAPINIYRNTLNPSIVGFDNSISDTLRAKLLNIVQFVWGPLAEYQYCLNLSEGQPQLFNSSKSMITKIIADEIGAETIVPETYYAKLILEGKERIGIVVGVADGVEPKKENKYVITGTLQKDLINLNLVDIITYQKDHRPGNYFVRLNKRKEVVGISAFDNDTPTTLFPYLSPKLKTYCGCTTLVNHGFYIHPFIANKTFSCIERLTAKELYQSINKYCSSIEAICTVIRFYFLKNAINRSVKYKTTTIINDDEWNDTTLNEEINNSKIGCTYLQLLLSKYN